MFGRNNILGITNLFLFNQTEIFHCFIFLGDNLQYINQETTNKDGASSLQTTAIVGERLPNLKQ